jgi:serine/threonine protein kinase
VTGENPFYVPGMDQMSTFEAIVQDDFEDPGGVSKEVNNLIRSLLQKDPTKRLGSLARGEAAILEHAWFTGFDQGASCNPMDLRAMRVREIEAPWVPDIKDPLDTSCFDNWDGILEDRTKTKYETISGNEQALFAEF